LPISQAVEHYEISRYGTLKQWAHQLGMKDAVRLLDETLQEEKKTDETLTSLAEAAVNLAAAAKSGVSVRPGLVPAIHVLPLLKQSTWMAGTSPAMTIDWRVYAARSGLRNAAAAILRSLTNRSYSCALASSSG